MSYMACSNQGITHLYNRIIYLTLNNIKNLPLSYLSSYNLPIKLIVCGVIL